MELLLEDLPGALALLQEAGDVETVLDWGNAWLAHPSGDAQVKRTAAQARQHGQRAATVGNLVRPCGLVCEQRAAVAAQDQHHSSLRRHSLYITIRRWRLCMLQLEQTSPSFVLQSTRDVALAVALTRCDVAAAAAGPGGGGSLAAYDELRAASRLLEAHRVGPTLLAEVHGAIEVCT